MRPDLHADPTAETAVVDDLIVLRIGRSITANAAGTPYARPKHPVSVDGMGEIGLFVDPEHEGCRKLMDAGFPGTREVEIHGPNRVFRRILRALADLTVQENDVGIRVARYRQFALCGSHEHDDVGVPGGEDTQEDEATFSVDPRAHHEAENEGSQA